MGPGPKNGNALVARRVPAPISQAEYLRRKAKAQKKIDPGIKMAHYKIRIPENRLPDLGAMIDSGPPSEKKPAPPK